LVEPRALSRPAALAGLVGGDLETIYDLLKADFWSLLRKCRMLAQPLDQKLFFPVH
jgi:hypothetical protein